MAKIHINKDDIKSIVESYSKVNGTFVIKSFTEKDNQKTCHFYINGKDCTVIFYVKKDCINIVPTGKNIEDSNLLINFVQSKGFSTKSEVNQFVFKCTQGIINNLLDYITDECNGLVTYINNDNIFKFTGYNGDILTFTFYPQSDKAMIQGKPFHAYSIIMSYLSGLPDFTFDQIVEFNNIFTNMNTPSSAIREVMQSKLGESYSFLDEALLKSISGSLTLLHQTAICEDYTGCVTCEFKALEGYLNKILSQKYSYTLTKNKTFGMFYKESGTPSQIESDANISANARTELIKLYRMYSNKRNVYLHATIDPSLTRIIPTLKEARDLSDDILYLIKDSYPIIFE